MPPRLRFLLPVAVVLSASCSSTDMPGSGNDNGGTSSQASPGTTANSTSGGNSSGGSQASSGMTGGTSNAGGGSASSAGSSNSSAASSGAHPTSPSADAGSRGSSSTTSDSGSSSASDASVACTGSLPSGGTQECSNSEGPAGDLSWQIWSNTTGGCITTYGSNPAFSATWDESSGSDFLARLGMVWKTPAPYTQFGTITAQFAETKTGTGGGFSYIGIYGWSLPATAGGPGCVEFYIVDDSYNRMPVNPGNTTMMGTATIDGGTYILYTRQTSGTGGSNCAGVSSWIQYYSIRETARSCGQISVTDHFNAWANAGMTLGNLQEAQVLVETGGGDGSIDFTTANVTSTQ